MACAVGVAVMEVIADRELQRNAEIVGAHFRKCLEVLREKHPLIGDVRGIGLFLGVELVKDPSSMEPAPHAAKRLVNLMREEGVLLSTDGPHHNVIKIKPPLVFTNDNVDTVVTLLDVCLSRIEKQ